LLRAKKVNDHLPYFSSLVSLKESELEQG